MTNDEIKASIAELLGYEYRMTGTDPTEDGLCWHNAEGKFPVEIPNWPQDLNACHDFEGDLTWRESGPYVFWLEEITNIGHMGGNARREPLNDCILITASALHRCQAFLRLKGKWIDQPAEPKGDQPK